ncbi:MAG: hydrogen peroxide-inducible genes activator [Micavibrio sp.]|nr:hydrogen peroxide-inducible genes activator [Micavibrio sp.]
MKPTIKQLEHLIALHEEGSFSRAADKCFITQSSLSASIKELEIILGQPLVNRSRKSTSLTALGLEALEQAHIIITATNAITTRAQHYTKPMSGTLRIGIIPTIAPYILPNLLPLFNEKYPDLDLRLQEDQTDNIISSLHSTQVDLAILAFPYETPGLKQTILHEEPFLAALPSGAPHADKIRIKDLQPEHILLLEDGHCLRKHALDACSLQLPKQRQAFRASSLPTLIEMVRSGQGMTLLPQMACRQGALPKGIDILPFCDLPAPSRQIGLCWSEKNAARHNFDTIAIEIKNCLQI